MEVKMNQFNEITPEMLKENTFHTIGKDWMLVTAGNTDKANTMTASWGGLGIMFGKNVAYVVIRPQRYTREFIDHEATFSLSFLDNSYRKKLNYLGQVSGRDEDKIAKSGLTLDYDGETPYFKEADTVMLCRKLVRQPLDANSLVDESLDQTFYPTKDYHILYIAEITKVLKK
jgi:flavin reductase (DIM6/NTAB) family NADH-FMN oxidoreductase RutF